MTTSILSGSMYYSKRDATDLGLPAVRCSVKWDKDANNGIRQIVNDGTLYSVNVNSYGALPTDMGEYKDGLQKVRDSLPVSPYQVVIENEILQYYPKAAATLVKMYGIAVDVFGNKVATCGTVFPVVNTLVYNATGDKTFRQRNSTTSAAKCAAWQEEISLIKASGLDKHLTYNIHYQLKDETYYPDYVKVVRTIKDTTGMNVCNNELAIRKNGAGMGKALAQCCLLHDYATVYNTTGQQGSAIKMNAATEAEFVSAMRF